ncbi:ligase-associated DNA damage response endonuclease PdeM [Ottowia thiooxydans]|uniref:ligase-associated DNA damage response endonuclease PdeM n=1 Tax=Ottowia thiooxydans TaxID=219182 RepID=UPI000418F8E1|nr:ligase-associated DNA damage response endonuclease PdeM [Ottowia thiooxydans]
MSDPLQQTAITIDLAGHQFSAVPGRALYWPAERMLMIADLHLGKSDTFRAFGISVPHLAQRHDLARLQQLLDELQPESLVILGDFVHGRVIGEDTRAEWAQFRHANRDVHLILTRGNHDRALNPAEWQFDEVVRELTVGNVVLSHEPLRPEDLQASISLNVHGHVHPVFRAAGWKRALPALLHDDRRLVLPAFSVFTGGQASHSPLSRVWVFAEDSGLVARVQ